jgi:hydrogenase maturation protease
LSILVMGIGNIFMSDDGIGVRLVQRLQRNYHLSPDVAVIDGGTLGLSLLPLLEGVDRLLVVDAIESGHGPGTVVRLSGNELPLAFPLKISRSQFGVQELLTAAKLLGDSPREIVIWGVQPALLEFGTELSPSVAARFDTLLEKVLEELAEWGVTQMPIDNDVSLICPEVL